MSDNLVIKVENLTKTYRLYNSNADRVKESLHPLRRKYHHEFNALNNLNFVVKKGEVLGILGRNGSGKSTLLKLITGVLTPTSGTVQVTGRISALLELGAGFNPELTGIENIYFNGTLMGYSRDAMNAKLDEILAFANIGEFVFQPVKSYSSGMFLRLAFAVHTIIEPDVLIIDEALSVGDVFFQQNCYKRLEKLREKGVTILFVTHAVADIMQFCDRALLLDSGHQVYIGSADKAVRRYLQRQQDEFHAETYKSSNDEVAETLTCSDGESLIWPDANHFLDISGVDVVSNGFANCTGIALCDGNRKSSKVFRQKEMVFLFIEFKLHSSIDLPIGGFVITNQKNVLVHGKSLMFYEDMNLPRSVRSGSTLRFMFGIELNIEPGQYTVDVGLSTAKWDDYVKRKQLPMSQMSSITRRLCSLSRVASFDVVQGPLQEDRFDYMHIGVCNLNSHCIVSVK